MSRATPTAHGPETARDPRAAILDAAASLLDESGAEGLTIRRLSLRSGYTPPAIYQVFGDKAGLLDALLERAFQGLVDRLEKLPVAPDPRDRMRQQFHEIVRFGREHPTHWRLLVALRPEEVPSAEAAQQRLHEPLESLARAGQLMVSDVEVVRQSLWALLHGLIALPTSRPDVQWSDELVDVAFEAMCAGLVRADGHGEGSR